MLERLGILLQWICFLPAAAASAAAVTGVTLNQAFTNSDRLYILAIVCVPAAVVILLGAGIRWLFSGVFTLWPWRAF